MPPYDDHLSWNYRHLITIPYTETAMLDFLDTLSDPLGNCQRAVYELIEYFYEQRINPYNQGLSYDEISSDMCGCWADAFVEDNKYLLRYYPYTTPPYRRFYSLYSVEKTDQGTETFKC